MLACFALACSFVPFQGQPQRSEALATRPLFVDPHAFLLPADLAPLGFALGDVDADGDLDVLVLETSDPFSEGAARAWFNLGAGRFRPGPATGVAGTRAELVDLDADGDLDGLVDEHLLVRTGPGFVPDPTPQPFQLPGERTFADFDGDGVKDAVYTYGGAPLLLLNDGAGHLSDASANLPAGLPATNYLASGDVDGDLDVDLLAGSFGLTYLLLNDGSAGFTGAPASLPATTAWGGFELTDVDGDLDLDALAYAELWTNDGAGVFSDASVQLPGTSGAGGLVFDLEGDGDPDLMAGDRVLVNDGSGFFALSPSLVPVLPAQSVGDLDGDGDADLVGGTRVTLGSFSYVPGSCSTVLGDGTGAFADLGDVRQEIESPRLSANRTLLADMDADGALDLVVASDSNTSPFGTYVVQTFLRLGTGHGRFGGVTPDMGRIQGFVQALAAADFEGDGDLDLLVGSREDDDGSGAGIKRLFQQPGLVFQHPEGPGTHLGVGDVSDFAVGDLDGDGDPDLAFGSLGISPPQNEGLALSDGSGAFTTLGAPSFAQQCQAVELLDVDQDGDLDACWLGDTAVLQRNDGASWTQVSAQLSFATGSTLAAGDYDLDGDSDLLVGTTTSLRLHRNNGSGSFSAARTLFTTVPAIDGSALHGRFADLEGDGDLDVLSQAFDPLWNDGSGRLVSGSWTARVSPASALGDLDQDGDLDLVEPLGGDCAVRTNRLRQVQWRNLPQLGRDLELELSGPRSQSYVLYSSPSTASVPVPGQGLLLLGAPLTTVASGTLDALGRAVSSVPVPNNLGLIGTTLHWQGLVGNAPRFTNRDSTTITGF